MEQLPLSVQQLCQTIDDVIGNYVHNFYETKEKLE